MAYTSKMAEAWTNFRVHAVNQSKSFDQLTTTHDVALRDLNHLREFGLLDYDEYASAMQSLTTSAVTMAREFARRVENA